MTEVKDNSSLPLLLSITGAVLAVAVGGWFFLYQESSNPTTIEGTTIVTPTADIETVPPEDAAVASEDLPVSDRPDRPNGPDSPGKGSSPDIDAELRKARLAADADILVLPPTTSALYYYGRVLNADPQHAIAAAEFDTILARVAQITSRHLAAEEYGEAFEIATLVETLKPDHELVAETQRTLDKLSEQLVAQAMQHAQDGNDEQATELLATSEALPGRDKAYFAAIRESIADIQNVREAAERDRAQRARLDNSEAKAAWVDRINRAIAAGNLISPAGASARDLLAERNSWSGERTRLTSEFLSAIVSTVESRIEDGQLDQAEALLNTATEMSGKPDGFPETRASLERALIRAESTRVAHMKELVQVKSVSPHYPRRAQERGTNGWVDIYFTITPTGETADIKVNQSEPKSVFDKAAISAVSKWAFQPVEYRGQTISQRAAARLIFRLE